MAKFNYRAKKGLEEIIEGVLEAESQDAVVAHLNSSGLFPIKIEEVVTQKQAKSDTGTQKLINRRITSGEILNFARKLTTLLRAKVELLSSLKILYEQTENARLREIILEIYDATKEGRIFSDSLEQFPKIFSPLFVNIVRAGEASGRLDLSLEQASEFLDRDEALKTRVKIALAYPALLIIVGLISVLVLMNFVVPKLKPIFSSMGGDLPLVTSIVLGISEFSQKWWWVVLLGIFITAAIIYQRKGSSFFSSLMLKIKLHLPILKRLTRNQELAQFSRSLALLIKSGVPALRALEIASLAIGESKLKNGLADTCKGVASGQTISSCLQVSTGLPNFFIKMIAVGEESGRLTEVLDEIARSYTQQIEADIALVSAIIEPVLILVLGLILGTIVLSILLPIFQVTQMVH